MNVEYIADFEKRTCRLRCGDNFGTAFLITPEIAITATHCISSHVEDANNNEILLEFLKLSDKIIARTAMPIHSLDNHAYPVIILKLDKKIDGISNTNFCNYKMEHKMTVETFGYPATTKDSGTLFLGTLCSIDKKGQYRSTEWNLGIEFQTSISNYKGLSGAPLFKNEHLVGVMGEQTTEGRAAVIVSGVDATLFEDYLTQNGLKYISIEPHAATADTIMSENAITTIGTLSSTIAVLTTQKNALELKYLSEKLDEIINTSINTDELAAWNILQKIVDDPSNQSESYADFFNLAAKIQVDKDVNLASKYYEILQKIKPSYDARSFLSAVHMQKQEWDKAIDILQPIDTTSVFNQLLQVYYMQNNVANFSTLCFDNIEKDVTSHNLLALCYLQNENYDRALEHIKYLNEKHSNSPLFWYLNGVANYLKFIPYKPKNAIQEFALPIYTANYITLSFEQHSGISVALESFKRSKALAENNNSKGFEIHSTIGCLLSSWILKDSVALEFCENLLKLDETNVAAISYLRLTQNEIPENYFDKFRSHVSSGDGTASEAVICVEYLIDKGNLNEAAKLLNCCEKKIECHHYSELIYLKLSLYLKKKNIKKAKQIIRESNFSKVEQIRASLLVCQYDSSATPKMQLRIARKAVVIQGDSIDYLNLCHCYRKYNMWKKISQTALEWFNKYDDIIALEYRAEALYNDGNIKKCLKTINNIEKIATLNNNIKKMQIWCFVNQGMFDEADVLIKDIGFPLEDKQLVITQAQMHVSKGEDLDAVSLYKAYLKNIPNDKDIVNRLVSLLCGCNMKEEAYKQLKQLADTYPNDLAILIGCMNLGFEIGHEDEASQLMVRIQQQDKKNEFLKQFTTKELKEFLEDNRKRYEKFDKDYLNGELPLHLLFDHKGDNMGYAIYQSLVDEAVVNFSCFGGRTACSSFDCFAEEKIIMDYTACLTAYGLGLFPKLLKYFKTIFIDVMLIPTITKEIAKLSSYQISVHEKHERLLAYINTTDKLRIVDLPEIPEEHPELNDSDLIYYYCAVKHNAFIVQGKFSTELLDNKEIPNCLRSIHIKEIAILSFLLKNGVSIPNIQETVSDEDMSNIQNGTTLLVDRAFLEQLQEYNALDDFIEMFDVIIMQFEYNILKCDSDGMSRQEKCKKWLESLKSELNDLYTRNVIKFLPLNAKKQDATIKYVDLLTNAIGFSSKSKISVWFDDRFVNSYSTTVKSEIVGILDILALLYDREILSKEEYFQNISSLIKKKLNFFVPPNEYIVDCLLRANNSEHKIIEATRLSDLRKHIQSAIKNDSFIGRQNLKHLQISEALLFLRNLDVAFHQIITEIWNNEEKDIYWKCAAGGWLLFYFSDFICDVEFGKNEDIANSIATKHSLLLMNSICIRNEYALSYCKWLIPFLNLYWIVNPTDLSLVADNIAQFVFNFEDDMHQEYLLKRMSLLFYGAYSLFYDIVNNSLFEGKWTELFKFELEEVQVDYSQNKAFYKEKIEGDLTEYLHSNPDKWETAMHNAIQREKEVNSVDAIVSFISQYVEKYTSSNINSDCRTAIALMAWYCKPEQRIALQELKRKLL